MANTVETEGKMTLEEFFEWQSRRDEPYELQDGVPCRHGRRRRGQRGGTI